MRNRFARRLLIVIFVAGCAGASTRVTSAQDAPPSQRDTNGPERAQGGVVQILEGLRSLLAELRLTDDQRAQAEPIFLATRDEIRALLQDPNSGQAEKARAVRARLDQTESALRGLLTDDQKAAFDTGMQELRQTARGNATTRPSGGLGIQLVQRFERALATLDLNEEQEPKVDALLDDARERLTSLRERVRSGAEPAEIRDAARALRDELQEKLLDILTPAQASKLRETLNADRPVAPRGRTEETARPETPSRPDTAARGEAPATPATRPADLKPIDIGAALPAFSLMRLDGATLAHLDLANKPAVLIFGSYSSPALRDKIARLQELADKRRSRATFVLIYTAEMYPADGQQPERNKQEKIAIAAHGSPQDRAATARTARDALKIRMEIAIDTMDATLQRTLNIGPNGAAVLKSDGTLAFKQDWADAYALERALDEVLSAPR